MKTAKHRAAMAMLVLAALIHFAPRSWAQAENTQTYGDEYYAADYGRIIAADKGARSSAATRSRDSHSKTPRLRTPRSSPVTSF